MKAVIMAGGEGSRLRPLTRERPKPLVPVCNRPVMSYILDLLEEHGFQEVFITLGYMPEAISNWFGERYRSIRLHYVVEESLMGTAGGIAALLGALDSTFLVLSGDALTDLDLTALVNLHRSRGAVGTLGLVRVENPLEYGLVLTDRRGRILRFLEKPGWGEVFSDTVNTGIYALEPEVFRGVPAGRPYDFSRDLFPALLAMEAPLYGACLDGYWCDIGDAAAYLQANLDLLAGCTRFRPAGREVAPGVWVSGEAPEGISVEGPALIGEGCRLEPGIRLEAGVVLGSGASVGAGAVLRRTVIWDGVSVGPQSMVVGGVLCNGVQLDRGTGVYAGAVVGSGCRIGAQATVSPGVRLWPRVEVGPGARVEYTLTQSPLWTGKVLQQGGLLGRVGADLFPESALRAGMAFASILAASGPVVIGGDRGAAPGMLKQALVCGAMAAGRRVIDVGITTSPVTEFVINRRRAAGGIHVRAGADRVRVVFYGSDGRLLRRDMQRKLEQVCLRQDFPRAVQEEAGRGEHFLEAERCYLEALRERIDLRLIRSAGVRITVSGASWTVLERWLDLLGCRTAAGGADNALRLVLDPLEAAWRLPELTPSAMMALEIWVSDAAEAGGQVPIPVVAPTTVETLLKRRGLSPVRVPLGEWRTTDPLLGIGRMLEWMAREGLSPADLPGRFPTAKTAARSVPCPWEAKGRIMRSLLEECADLPVDMVDGLRISLAEGEWALVLPDPDEPVYRVYAEGQADGAAERLADRYAARIDRLVGEMRR